MRSFVKPTKVTWIAFAILLAINFVLGILGILDENWHLFVTLLFQIIWLYFWVPEWTNIDVTGKGGFIPLPNFLGWLLIIIGSLVSFTIYYLIASLASQYYYKKREINQYKN